MVQTASDAIVSEEESGKEGARARENLASGRQRGSRAEETELQAERGRRGRERQRGAPQCLATPERVIHHLPPPHPRLRQAPLSRLCVRVCVCARARACVCHTHTQRERERERERQRERETERERGEREDTSIAEAAALSSLACERLSLLVLLALRYLALPPVLWCVVCRVTSCVVIVCVCVVLCGVLCGVMCCVRFCFVGRESANQDFGGIVLCQQFARARIVRVQAADAARGLQRLLCTPMLVCMCACLYLCTYLRVRARMYPLRMFVCLCMSYVHAWCVCKHASTSI